MENEKDIKKIIKQKSNRLKTFEEIISGFEKKLETYNPLVNFISVNEYFGAGKGPVTAKELLLKNKKIKKDWLRTYKTKKGNEKEDFKGLYIFLNEKKPFYIGISKGDIGRIDQHVKGKNHNTATLAFKIAVKLYELREEKEFDGERSDLHFEDEVVPVIKFLRKQHVAFIPIDNDEELALFEIYCSMKYQTGLNTFETH